MMQKQLPLKLRNLIQYIESVDQIENSQLIEMTLNSGILANDLDEFSEFNHDQLVSYGRRVLYVGKNFSIYLMSWAPGDFTAIHSHGRCDWGVVLFLGDINHRLYTVDGNVVRLKSADVIPGSTVVGVKGELVHAMGNLRSGGVMSLHIYGSNNRLSNANDFSKVYELENKVVKITNGAAFINISAPFVKNSEPGPGCDRATLIDYLQIVRPIYARMKMSSMVETIDGYLDNPSAY